MQRPSLFRTRPLPLAIAAIAVVSCIGPQESDRPPDDGPTEPTRPTETHLRGQVLVTGTNAPVGGAKVDAGEGSSITDSLGNYNIQHLTFMAATLVTTKVGYDTARVIIPLEGGDKMWVVRLNPSVP